MRILLAEDDEMLADAIFRTLSQNAHRVDTVRNGQQADDALSANDERLWAMLGAMRAPAATARTDDQIAAYFAQAADAIGAENVFGVSMPSKYSS